MLGAMRLELERPFVVFDIESTGINRKTDRIIELALVKVHPDGERETLTLRVNPGIPIPPAATAIHGIKDEDVRDCPSFEAVAAKVAAFLADADLGGYNLLHFDIPMLTEEFQRAGLSIDLSRSRVIDAQRIFHKKEPRDLSAALSFYCGAPHDGAHSALADVEATLRVIEGELERYPDLPTNMAELAEYCNPVHPSWVDPQGKLAWDDQGEVCINFGKNQGRRLRDLSAQEPSYLDWMLRKDFPSEVQDIVREARNGRYRTQSERDEA
jgi:DNA polymerase-3 subunit epsilon